MKKKLKVFFIYVGVILLSLLMTVVVCAAFLFFYREGSIFRIRYIKNDEVLYANMQNIEIEKVGGISIESQGFDVRVSVESFTENIQAALINKSFGYVHKSKAQASISVKFDEGTRLVMFEIVEPEGWVSKKDCYVVVVVPKSLIDNNIDMNIKTEKADILIGGEEVLSLESLDVCTTKGEMSLTNVNIVNSFNIDVGNGELYVDDKCTASSVNVNVKIGDGKINFTKIKDFEIKTLRIEEIKTGLISVLKAWEVVTAGSIRGGGRIEIGQAVELEILTLDTDIKVGTIGELGSENITTSRIDIAGNGDVEILNAYSKLQLTGHNGSVRIGTATGTITISTTQGDIAIDNAYGNVSIDTQYGNATILFSEDAPQYGEGGRVLVAGTKNGHIISKGVQNANVSISDKGRADIEYDLVRGKNRIVSSTIGNINIIVPHKHSSQSVALDLYVISRTMPDVELGTVSSDQAKLNDGYYELPVDNVYGNNILGSELNVESEMGNIKIRSSDMINF